MANIGSFNAADVKPLGEFTVLPTGEYKVQIVDSDVKPTKKNDGNFAELRFEVMEGEYKGAPVYARLNLDNPNPKAVEIAQRELSSICHAVNKLQIRDTQELHHKPMIIRVEFVPADPAKNRQYDNNEIKAYKAIEGAQAATGQNGSGSTSTPATSTPTDNTPAWVRKAA